MKGKLLQTLIKWRSSFESGIYFVSIYYGCVLCNSRELEKQLSGFIKTELRKSELKEYRYLHKIMEEEIATYIDKKVKVVPGGLAIFFKFDVAEKNKKKTCVDKAVTELTVKPKESVFIGKVADVGQLAWLLRQEPNALIINLDKEVAKLSLLKGKGITPLYKAEKPNIFKKEKEYIQKFSPKGLGSIYHSTGSIQDERQEKKEMHYMLIEAEEFVRSEQNRKLVNIKNIIIFYSATYEIYVGGLVEFLEKTLNKDVEIVQENINGNTVLEQRVSAILAKKARHIYDEEMVFLKENPYLAAIGFTAVAIASREGRISKLYVKLNSKREGYLLNHEHVYEVKTANSRKVKNIIPWLVNRALSTGSEIYNYDVLPSRRQVVARLRY